MYIHIYITRSDRKNIQQQCKCFPPRLMLPHPRHVLASVCYFTT